MHLCGLISAVQKTLHGSSGCFLSFGIKFVTYNSHSGVMDLNVILNSLTVLNACNDIGLTVNTAIKYIKQYQSKSNY